MQVGDNFVAKRRLILGYLTERQRENQPKRTSFIAQEFFISRISLNFPDLLDRYSG